MNSMKVWLGHIGVAVQDTASLTRLKRLFELMGLETTHTESVPSQGVTTHFLPLPNPNGETSSLEFLEVIDPEGTVAQFLKKRGPGIHHLSFEVSRGSLDPLLKKIALEGYKLIYSEPKPGAHHMRVNFIHPSSGGGMLIELMEKA